MRKRGSVTVVLRYRSRIHLNRYGGACSHPQYTCRVFAAADWVACGSSIIRLFGPMMACRDLSSQSTRERYDFVEPPLYFDRNGASTNELARLRGNANLIVDVLSDRATSDAAVSFGSRHFASEAMFLNSVADALDSLPPNQIDLWLNLSISAGIKLGLPGLNIMWLPTEDDCLTFATQSSDDKSNLSNRGIVVARNSRLKPTVYRA